MGIKGYLFKIAMVLILISAVFVAAEEVKDQPEEIILAEYKDGEITKADFDEEFERIPMMYRSRFSSLAGQQELLNSILISKIFLLKAEELEVNQREAVQDNIARAMQGFYANEFRLRDITEQTEISQAELTDYYNEQQARFKESPNTVIRYIMTESEEEAVSALEALKSGDDFIDVMNRYSINTFSKRHQGVIRNIRSNGYIAGVGMDEELDAAIAAAALNSWAGPVVTENGIHLFQVTEREPERVKPLEEVREEIISRLRPAKEIAETEVVYSELKEKYALEIDYELLEAADLGLARPDPEMLDRKVVTASVPELEITLQELNARFQRISPQERAQIANPEYRNRLLDDILMNTLFAYEGKAKGYDEFLQDNHEVQMIRRNIILTELFNELVVSQAVPSPEEIAEHYQENIDSYTTRERRSVRLFLFSSNKEAKGARKEVARGIKDNDEEKIEAVIANSLYSDNNGMIMNIYREQNLPSIEDDEKIKQVIWQAKPDELSKIERDGSGNYFFIQVLNVIPEEIQPLAQAEERISALLARERQTQLWEELQGELKEEYEVVSYPERLALMKSARELFDLAEEAMKKNRHLEAVQYYDQIIDHHHNNEDDYKALFMKAFVMAEELKRTDEAIELFRRVISDYPASDLHESAEYMIKTLEEGHDLFETLE
jgi:parvulin-like peptidyl-prolyl isomerase